MTSNALLIMDPVTRLKDYNAVYLGILQLLSLWSTSNTAQIATVKKYLMHFYLVSKVPDS